MKIPLIKYAGGFIRCSVLLMNKLWRSKLAPKSVAVFLILIMVLTIAIPISYGAAPLQATSKGDNGSNGDDAYAGVGGDGGDDGDDGGNVSVSNNGGNGTIYAPQNGQNQGIYVKSQGGNGGDGGNGYGAGDGYDGGDGGNGGTATVVNNGAINSNVSGGGGIYAISVGGNGGDGGDVSYSAGGSGGDGGAGGNGGTVNVTAETGSSITTQGDNASGIYAASISGNGGQGGEGSGIYGGGGSGSESGKGGSVYVTNKGIISTNGKAAYGIFAESVGGFAGSGGGGYGIVGYGGGSTSGGDGGYVAVTNSGSITTGSNSAIDSTGSSAIFVQSVGGGGGSAGSGGGIVGIGGSGDNGGNGGALTVTNSGVLTTYSANSYGIFAQSIGGGGGDGGHSGGLVSIGGSGDGGGNGKNITITNNTGGNIITLGKNSDAIFAQSIGGGGGTGGTSGGWLSVGGSGGSGGDGATVNVYNNASLTTSGSDAKGIFAQSIGGGGGNGGGSFGGGAFFALEVGGKGGPGGDGGQVSVTSGDDLSISTTGDRSFGIQAQSIGGGGGNGGNAAGGSVGKGFTLSAVIGGKGGDGGNGGTVTLDNKSDISTSGMDAHGIYAQSIGGGGGDGGFSIAVSGGNTFAGSFSLGGSGGDGGNGNSVNVTNQGSIVTSGSNSYGIQAQSIGGGGGGGGFSASGALGSIPVAVSIGGSGGAGGNGNLVTVTNQGSIFTSGSNSYGIQAQSIGGGGGNGAFSFSGALGKKGELSFSLGGSGGSGGDGGAVKIINNGSIETSGLDSHGILAQSIGGGGGNGGSSYSFALGKGESNMAIGAAVGGKGGWGAIGNTVEVTTGQGSAITTWGDNSYGINAQSIGGGGGNGGSSLAVDISKSSTEAEDARNTTVNISVGGEGGIGNKGGAVTVDSSAAIYTYGNQSYGISGQSIGGGGGNGGKANAVTLQFGGGSTGKKTDMIKNTSNWNFTVAVGGNGGIGGDGGAVDITNSGSILTEGQLSSGIVAQSIGGGGGNGGAGVLGTGITELDGAIAIAGLFGDKTSQLSNLAGAVGGNGGSHGDGKAVTVENSGNIATKGLDAYGIFAQSIGGGGGLAQHFAKGEGDGGSATVGVTGKIGVGGAGGSAGDGDIVTIINSGNILTWGAGSYGILAQSIGGGGGVAGNVVRGLATFIPDGGVGIGFGYGQNGGSGGNGGSVVIDNTGNITTHGDGANGILAQSVGGGGGLNGSQGYGLDTIADYIPYTDFSGSVGGFGGGGDINITQSGNIITTGDAAHGIFAQSAGSRTYTDTDNKDQNGVVIGDDSWKEYTGVAGDINITVKAGSSIIASGKNSDGIFAQSLGTERNGKISVTVEEGAFVQGGTENGHGVAFKDGSTDPNNPNILNNYGTITALSCANPDGYAVYVEDGNETINNYGTIIGNIELGGTGNIINNFGGKLVNSGFSVNLGGGTFYNSGTLSPGGSGNVQTTTMNGSLVLEDSSVDGLSIGVSSLGDANGLDIELDGRTTLADRVDVSGTATLDGALNLNLLNPGRILPGTFADTIITGSDIIGQFDTFNYHKSAVVNYQLDYNATEVVLNYTADFAAAGLNANRTALGNYFNTIQEAGGTDGLAPIVADLVNIPDVKTLGKAYDQLSPYTYDNTTRAGIELNHQFLQPLRKHMSGVRISNNLDNPGSNKGGGWFDGFIAAGDGKGVTPDTDFTYQSNGKTLGFDNILANGNGLIGFSVGMGQSQLDSEVNNIDGTAVSFYGYSWLSKQTYLEGLVSFDSLKFVNQRSFKAGASARQAGSNHSGQSFMLSFGGGRYFPSVKNWSIEMTTALEVINLAESKFEETGAGAVNLIVQKRNTLSSFLRLGLNMTRDFTVIFGKITPEFGVMYIRNIGYHGRGITASFTDFPDTTFTVHGRPLAENDIAVNVGMSMFTLKGASIRLGYTGEWYDSCQSRNYSLKVGFKF